MKSLIALLLAIAGAFFEEGPDKTIFPPQRIPVAFDHAYHVRKPDEAKGIKGERLECTFCHENISDSKLATDRDIPGHDSCDSCHDQVEAQDQCSFCHKDLLEPSRSSTVASPLLIPD